MPPHRSGLSTEQGKNDTPNVKADQRNDQYKQPWDFKGEGKVFFRFIQA